MGCVCYRSHPTERFVVDVIIVRYEYVMVWFSRVTDEGVPEVRGCKLPRLAPASSSVTWCPSASPVW